MTRLAATIKEDFRRIDRDGAILLGGGKQAELLLDLLEWSGCDIRKLRVFDDRCADGGRGPRGLAVEGVLCSGVRLAAHERLPALIALGSKQAALRDCLFDALSGAGAFCPRVVHPQTILAPSATLEDGVMIFPGCTIGPHARIGRGATLCQGVVLEHDTHIGNNAWIGPRATTSGFVSIGEHSFVGAGAIVTREASIGPRTLVGAGSLVLSDLPSDTIAFGSPAKMQSPLRPGMDAPLASDWEQHRIRFRSLNSYTNRPSFQELSPC